VGSDAIELEATIDSPFCQLFVIRHAILLGLKGRHGMLKSSVRGSQKDDVFERMMLGVKAASWRPLPRLPPTSGGFGAWGRLSADHYFITKHLREYSSRIKSRLAKPCTWKRETKCILHQELADNKMGSIGIEPFQVSHCPSLMTGHADHRR
jgi:hypothetical protein